MKISVRLFTGIFALGLLLSACGGGGGSSGSSTATVSGTAATGAPLANATVTLKDANGQLATTTTGSDGSYSVNVAGLSAPFLLKVSSGGTTLYSLAGSANSTANLNAYTTLAMQAYYTTQGVDVQSTISGNVSTSIFPGSVQLGLIAAELHDLLDPYLSAAGIAQPASFNPFTTPFSANHSGFDQVLDRTVLNANMLSLSVDNGSGSTAGAISSTLSVGTGTGKVTLTTSTSDSSRHVSSSAQSTLPVAANASAQADLLNAERGVQATFIALHQLAVNKGGTLANSDVASFIDSNFLDRGSHASDYAATLVQAMSGSSAGDNFSVSLLRVNGFTDINGYSPQLDAVVALTRQSGGVSTTQYIASGGDLSSGMVFQEETGGAWAFYGQQTAYNAQITLPQTRHYDSAGNVSNYGQFLPLISVAPGTFIDNAGAVTLIGAADTPPDTNSCPATGSPLDQNTMILTASLNLSTIQTQYQSPCLAGNGGAAAALPAAGSSYTFDLIPVNGGLQQQSYVIGGSTNDNGDIGSINATSRASFVANNHVANLLGDTLSLSYSEPTTYPLLYSYISGACQNTAAGGDVVAGSVASIAPGTDSGSITIPASCDGAATAAFTVSVNFVGLHGEHSVVTQQLQD